MIKIFKTATLGIAFLFCFLQGSGQNTAKKKKPDYSKNPHWIQMMSDSTVNFFEADKAFREFWKNREEPEIEENEKHEKKKRSLLRRMFESEEKEQAENAKYLIEYKRFKQWRRDVEPFVQPDGSILSKEEQMKIWENSRK